MYMRVSYAHIWAQKEQACKVSCTCACHTWFWFEEITRPGKERIAAPWWLTKKKHVLNNKNEPAYHKQQNRIMDDVCIAAAMRLQLYVCFEQCRQGWKESPINVKCKGVLHDSWKTFTSLVRLLEMSREGMYMHTHLERVCKRWGRVREEFCCYLF